MTVLNDKPPRLPSRIYIVYYKGENNQWIFSVPSFYKKNSLQLAQYLNRPTKVLTYKLQSEETLQTYELKSPKVRKVRKVKSNGTNH